MLTLNKKFVSLNNVIKLTHQNIFPSLSLLSKFNFSSAAAPALKIVKQEVEKPKLKIKSNLFTGVKELQFHQHKDIPLITIKQSSLKRRQPGKTFSIKSADLSYSSYKLNENCRLIRGKYVHQALEILSSVHTKGAKLIVEELKKYMEKMEKERNRRKEEGEDVKPEYYKIVEAYVGRKNGIKVPSPRAKGKMDFITRNISRFYMHIEKVDETTFMENVAIGKADFTFAHEMRKFLFTSGASLQMMRNLSFITTSKGRFYRHKQYLRLIQHLKQKYYKEKGILLSNEIVEKHIKVRLGQQLAQLRLTPDEVLADQPNISDFQRLKIKAYTKIEEELKPSEEKEKSEREKRIERFNENFTKI